jgi:type I restriction enzyme, S subunit
MIADTVASIAHRIGKDRTDWTTVSFGDVVRNIDEHEREPLANDIERFVGLEHLDPESLHIRRWGMVTDGTSFTRRFRPGHVLFGKRRAYQRKAAVAEWDGICSGDILVFAAKDECLLPELLPFIVQTDAFVDHALSTSAGSLSPRTKWSDLARFEFALPPMEQQERIAEVLAELDVVVSHWNRCREAAADLQAAVLETAAFSEHPADGTTAMAVGDLVTDIRYGSSARASAIREQNTPILRIPNVIEGKINTEDLKYISLTALDAVKFRLDEGDILIVRTNGNPDYVGRSALVTAEHEGMAYASYLIRVRPKKSLVRPEFLRALLASRKIRETLRHEIRSSAGNFNLNVPGLARQMVQIPSFDDQDRAIKRLSISVGTSDALANQINLLRHLRRRLLSSLLSD